MTVLYVYGVAFGWVLPIVVAHGIGAPKNRVGWAWGCLLSWVGVVIVALLGPLQDEPPTVHAVDASVEPLGPPPSDEPAPGWYTDPQIPSYVRYWDGSSWTHHAAPV